jgi:hypothetical protein
MLPKPSGRLALTSIAFLLVVMALALAFFFPRSWLGPVASRPPDGTRREPEEVADLLPEDLALAIRVASRWSSSAKAIARAEGIAGSRMLDLFGDDAAELFSEDPHGFHELTALAGLDRPLILACTGPWRDAVLQWARSGKLAHFRAILERLNEEQRTLLAGTPACLPLLGRGAATAESMLSRHGDRAWGLFLTIDFAEDLTGVERVAGALAIHGERMLRVNESHGPALSLLFVAPDEDTSGRLPRLFAEAIDRLGVDDAGALFLANHDDLTRLVLDEGRAPEEIVEAFDLLAGQLEEVKALTSDSGRVLRLLLERRGRVPIGVEILSRCGPEAADLLFEQGGYASDAREKAAVLAILARRGWPGVELLRSFRDDEKWHRLIRRVELLDSDDEPLIVRLAGKLEASRSRQDDIERYLEMPREQILGLDLPPTLAERALDWVPGYLAVHTTYQAARGYRLETSEVAWALLDGVTTLSFIGKLAGQTIKTVGKQAPKAAIEGIRRQAIGELEAKLVHQSSGTLMTRFPGVLRTTTRELPGHLPTLDITSVIRSGSAIARKLGLRTWGKLDRRIIMRGDRKVILDLSDPQVISMVGDKLRDELSSSLREEASRTLRWGDVARSVGVLGPCIMEQVHPELRSERFDARTTTYEPTSPRRPGAERPFVPSGKLSDHPASTAIGSALIVVCVILAFPRAREGLTRRLGLGQERKAGKPRRFQE